MCLGRRTNIDINKRLVSGMEKRDVFSSGTEEEDLTAYAHSRDRTLLKKLCLYLKKMQIVLIIKPRGFMVKI